MSNTLLTPDIVAKESLMILENNLVMGGLVTRGKQEEFTGAKVGESIRIRRPASFTAQEFTSTITVQDATEQSSSLKLEKHFDVSWNVGPKEKTLSIEDFSSQFIEPAMIAHAQAVDSYILSKYYQFAEFFGTATDPPDSIADLLGVSKKLSDQKVPARPRVAVVDTQAELDLLSIEAAYSAEKRGDGGMALREASMGRIARLDWFMDQNVKSHTSGDATGTGKVNGAHAIGVTAVAIDGFGASDTLKQGDILDINGTKYSVDADVALDGTGAGTVTLTAPTVEALAGEEDVADPVASHVANLAFHPNAFTFAAVPLELPDGAAFAQYIQARNMGVRVVADYNPSTKAEVWSLDILVGAKVQQPELGCRILG